MQETGIRKGLTKRQKEFLFFICLLALPLAQFCIFYIGVNFNSLLLTFRNYDFENGVDLSGGERQRLAISRAYMNNKRVMIMDEPTAALDPIAEMKQYQSISSMMAENTAILVSHRIGFARLASRIIVMDDGRVAEQGTHEELIAVNGGYKALFDAQSEWYQ